MSDNLRIYNAGRSVPQDAQTPIQAGRLKGKTDINPMWRIKALTERFGPCGIGWWYTIDKQWLEQGAGGEIAAFCNITLYYREGEQVSYGISGTGGSSFVAKEKGGLYTSDECYKMALTDAISVACKAMGFGADIYWSSDRSKYEKPQEGEQRPSDGAKKEPPKLICIACKNPILSLSLKGGGEMLAEQVAATSMKLSGTQLCYSCFKRWKNGENI